MALDMADWTMWTSRAAAVKLPAFAAGQEVLQVTDLHGSKLDSDRTSINSIDEAKQYQSLDTMACSRPRTR
jgi:hypothetical protein